MRTLNATVLEAIASQNTDEVFITLVTFDHPSLADPVRFSNTPVERHSTTPLIYKAVSRGDDYFFIPMSVVLPSDNVDNAPQGSLSISNVGRELIATLRSLNDDQLKLTMEMVLQSDLDTVFIEFPEVYATSFGFDVGTVELSFSADTRSNEPWPAYSYSIGQFPGMF